MLCLCLITISNLVPTAGMILATLIAALFIVYWLAIPRLKKAGKSALIKETSFQSEANDVFQNICTIQRYQAETFSTIKLQERQIRALLSENTCASIQLALTTVQNLLLHISHVMLIFILGSQVMTSSISLGTCYLILSYRHFLTESVKGLGYELLGLLALRLHLDRISDFYLYQPSEPITRVNSIEPGPLILRNLSIVRMDKKLLYPFTIQLNPGQLLIIQGPSGCGKSTLIEAIAGSIPIAGGTLSWGSKPFGSELHQWSPQQVGSVLDSDRLHMGTIASNIRMHQPGGNPGQLQAAAGTALLDQDIMALPLAYDTLISASNVPLSLGQTQKLLIARALYQNPKLLLLDESTANLDTAAEEQLLGNLRQLGMTLVIATHRDHLTPEADIVLTNKRGTWHIEQRRDY
jgi:ATP-binding cassette subfamily B protein RaxB